jgi:hypothetical protein
MPMARTRACVILLTAALAGAGALAISSCTAVPRVFRCADSAACVDAGGRQGTCEPSGWCSFADAACDPAGRRYGEFAGDGVAGLCVGAVGGGDGGMGSTCGLLGEACCAGDVCSAAGVTCQAGVCVGCVTQLAIGDAHGCALKRDGTVACWGKNDHGQLGNGSTSDAAAAVVVVDSQAKPIAGITAITSGANHTCALKSDRTALCWGDDSAGQEGRGGSAAVNPVPLAVALTTMTSLSAGARHTCATIMTGETWCWGANDAGQLGAAPSAGASMPLEVVDRAGVAIDATAVAQGATHGCAIARDKGLLCWGSNASGELGDGTMSATALLTQAASLGKRVIAAAAGAKLTCARLDDGSVFCVGLNDKGQAGQPAGTAVAVPTRVAIDPVTAIAAGGAHVCARLTGARLSCWGDGAAPAVIRQGVGAIGLGATETCSARGDGIDCAVFGDPHLACP